MKYKWHYMSMNWLRESCQRCPWVGLLPDSRSDVPLPACASPLCILVMLSPVPTLWQGPSQACVWEDQSPAGQGQGHRRLCTHPHRGLRAETPPAQQCLLPVHPHRICWQFCVPASLIQYCALRSFHNLITSVSGFPADIMSQTSVLEFTTGKAKASPQWASFPGSNSLVYALNGKWWGRKTSSRWILKIKRRRMTSRVFCHQRGAEVASIKLLDST